MGEGKCSKTIQGKSKGRVFNERSEEQVIQESHWIPSLRGWQEALDVCDSAPVKGRGMQLHRSKTERKKIKLQVSWDSCDEDISETSLMWEPWQCADSPGWIKPDLIPATGTLSCPCHQCWRWLSVEKQQGEKRREFSTSWEAFSSLLSLEFKLQVQQFL